MTDSFNPTRMRIAFNSFNQRGSGKAHNEDTVLLNDPVHQGIVREHDEVETSQPCYFAMAIGVATGTLPCAAIRLLLELLQSRFAMAPGAVLFGSV